MAETKVLSSVNIADMFPIMALRSVPSDVDKTTTLGIYTMPPKVTNNPVGDWGLLIVVPTNQLYQIFIPQNGAIKYRANTAADGSGRWFGWFTLAIE